MYMVLPLCPLSTLIMWLLGAWETLLVLNTLCMCALQPHLLPVCIIQALRFVPQFSGSPCVCVNTSTTGLSALLVKFSLQSHLHSLVNFTEFVGKTRSSWRLDTSRHLPLSLSPCLSGVVYSCDELFGLVWNCFKRSLTPKINIQFLVHLI